MVFLPGDHVLDRNIQCNQADHACSLLQATYSNSCLQWVSWLQLHEYGGLQHLFFSIYLLQQILELW